MIWPQRSPLTDRDGTAIDVHFLRVDAEAALVFERDDGEGLVELPEINVVHGQAVAREQARYGHRRSNAHLVRLTPTHDWW